MKLKYIVLAIILFTGYACRNKKIEEAANEASRVKITKIGHEMISLPIRSTGIVTSSKEIKLSFKTNGVIADVFFDEGAKVRKGDILGEVSGKTKTLLAGERLSLNILQRLSGIATLTSFFVDAVMGTDAKIIDTRKTTPCLRFMEKYSVRTGGGVNHRFGLFDAILIKDNHIEAVGSITKAVELAKAGYHLAKIEVEVENLNDLQEAVEAGADVIMLDNMSINDMKEAVNIVQKRIPLEASGNVSLQNVREIAETGVDLISVGALTHSAVAADISLKIVR